MSNSLTDKKFSLVTWVKDVLTEHFRIRKFNSPLGYLFIAFVTIVITFAIAKINFLVGAGVMGLLIGGGMVLVCLFDTKWGFYISTASSFFVFYFNRMINDVAPVGVVIDIFITITFVGIYFKKTMAKGKYWEHSKNPITYVYFLMIAFLVIEAFNPSMLGLGGWIFSFRKFLNFIMIYFTALHVFKSMDDVKQFIKIYLILCVICGVYGCFQEWHGLLGFESHWVMSDPLKWRLYFQGGTIRKWSLLSDPTSYGMLMANAAILALILAMGPASRRQRIYYVVGSMFMLMGMAYSGTRTATAMIPAGLVLFVLMTITSKKTLAFAISFLVLFIVIIFGPIHSNGTINRIRSTFEFSEDESFNIRDVNRHYIQPYMWRHPLGGGLSTTGVQGEVYNPGHELAGFPPDSGYLKAALETGPLGLLLTCIVYFVVLQVGIRNYYRTKDPVIRSYYVGIISTTFAIIVAHYAQVAIGQIPGAFLFYGSAAAMVKMRSFDQTKKEEETQPETSIL
ncbi:O-antigen ligase family protein [Chitinophaga horti]|uniref:O-antigen ligase family protein n=1 Tax=Chitinophaga horti TaxID=2920382 RepID=A0ABY6J6D4_9BACT|nr:O-antigen ligase family protein [Chitinophaga horti]UYQ95243.1 O-antigen ligase family protein [Chitinophaga horti]